MAHEQSLRIKFRFSEAVTLQSLQNLAMAKRGGRRSIPNLGGRVMDQIMRRKGLHQPGLPVAASTNDHTLHGVEIAAPDHYINGALLARVLARRSTRLHRVSHFGELAFAFLLG